MITATLYLTKRNAWVVSPGDTSRALLEKQWDGADVSDIFQQISQSLGVAHLTVILGHDISYVFVLPKPVGTSEADIWLRVQEHLPIDLSQKSGAVWRVIAGSAGSAGVSLQVVAVQPILLQTIIAAAQQAGIQLQAITAIGTLLSAYATAAPPQIILWESLERLAVIAVAGAAYAVTDLPASVTPAFIMDQRSFAQSQWGTLPSTIIVDERTTVENLTALSKECTIQQLFMDPFRFDPAKPADPWKNMLLLPTQTPRKPGKPDKPRKRPSGIVIVGGFIIVVLLITLWLLFNFRY